MLSGRNAITILSVVAALALVHAFIPGVRRSAFLWLLVVAVIGPWAVWGVAKQLYTAAMHGYLLTGIPEARVYRDDDPKLYRNNVVGNLAIFPIVTGGAAIMLLDALRAAHLIR